MIPAGPPRGVPFPRERLDDDVDVAAAHLLGALLVRDAGAGAGAGPRVGRIVEVEAYGGSEDAASHARFTRSSRREAMATAAGSAYVYLVYGMHSCLNVVTGPVGRPAAVLIRAVQPLAGLAAMRDARAASSRDPARVSRLPDARLASGPALVAAAFDVERSMTGMDLCSPEAPLRLEFAVDDAGRPVTVDAGRIRRTPRVGVAYAPEPWRSLPRRLFLADEPAVSRPRA